MEQADIDRSQWFSEVNKQGIVKILKKLEKKLPLVVKDNYLASKVRHYDSISMHIMRVQDAH